MKHNITINLMPSNAIRLRVTYGGKRIDISTGISYEPDKWRNGRPKPNTVNANRQTAGEVNSKLAAMEERIDKYFMECELSGKMPDADTIRNLVRSKHVGDRSMFTELYDRFVSDNCRKKSLSDSRIDSFRYLRNTICRLMGDFPISDITDVWVKDFKCMLKDTYMANTVRTFQTTFDMFLRYLKRNKLCDVDIEETRVSVNKVDEEARVYLTREELDRFSTYNCRRKYQNYVRDVFTFCCWTGLRFSDVWRVRKSDIGNDILSVVTLKTKRQIHIDLNKHAREIIDRYKASNPENELLFPSKVDPNYYNVTIKSVAEQAGIYSTVALTYFKGNKRYDEQYRKCDVLSSHAARRTFVVMCLQQGIPPLVIMKWTGHRSLSAMQPYIAIVDSTKAAEMEKLNK